MLVANIYTANGQASLVTKTRRIGFWLPVRGLLISYPRPSPYRRNKFVVDQKSSRYVSNVFLVSNVNRISPRVWTTVNVRV
jgi:hypothetical protein